MGRKQRCCRNFINFKTIYTSLFQLLFCHSHLFIHQIFQRWSQCDGDRQLHLFCVPEGSRQRRLHQDPQWSERSRGQDVCHLGERSGTSSLYDILSLRRKGWVCVCSNKSYHAASSHCCLCNNAVCIDEVVGWRKRCLKQDKQQHNLKLNSSKCWDLQVACSSLMWCEVKADSDGKLSREYATFNDTVFHWKIKRLLAGAYLLSHEDLLCWAMYCMHVPEFMSYTTLLLYLS